MKKVIRLNENDVQRITKRVLSEQANTEELKKLLHDWVYNFNTPFINIPAIEESLVKPYEALKKFDTKLLGEYATTYRNPKYKMDFKVIDPLFPEFGF